MRVTPAKCMYFLILTEAGNKTLCEPCNIVVTNVALVKILNLSLNKMETITVENIV